MPQQKTHDLHDFMRQISEEMEAEYNRIQKRATEDPGTAGDQGEENWAALLKDWLPRDYEVVTKGRIISQEGITSPQIDVIVLKGSYPKKLLGKKLYLAAGVAAAFECKTTLRASHISEAIRNSIAIKSLYPIRAGTPYRELHTPVIYGLLAHSHDWKKENSTPVKNIEETLNQVDASLVTHPRQQLDLLCVADLAAWTMNKKTIIGPLGRPELSMMISTCGPIGSATSCYQGHICSPKNQASQITPIGVLISCLSKKLAWENPSLRDIAEYYRKVKIAGSGQGIVRMWPTSIYSDEIRSRIETGEGSAKPWDEWRPHFP
ncbi:MAG: hypothetical protein Q8K61_12595 [Gallionella sp.]|nr:hypothetical protein [Gallionella sp.]